MQSEVTFGDMQSKAVIGAGPSSATALVIGMMMSLWIGVPPMAHAASDRMTGDLNIESRYDRFVPKLAPEDTIMPPKARDRSQSKKRDKKRQQPKTTIDRD